MDGNGVLCRTFLLPFLEMAQRQVHFPGALGCAHPHLSIPADTLQASPHRHP